MTRGAATGTGFQEAVNHTNAAYERLGRACITRKSVPGKFLLRKQDLEFIPESKAEPDYGGTVSPGGRAIFYDAKTTQRESLDFDNLHAHQIGFLERMALRGAIAGFLVEFRRYDEVYFLPIQVLAHWRDNVSRKSLPRKFFVEHLIAATSGQGLVLFDYLASIEGQEQRYGADFSSFQLLIKS
jgi:recombination protein U